MQSDLLQRNGPTVLSPRLAVTQNYIPPVCQFEHQTRSLFDLLHGNAGRACSKQEIARAAWPEYQAAAHDYQVESLVKRLREKLEPDPRNPVLILTVRGQGYKLSGL